MNPITSLQFKRFVSIKGGNNENNVLFWQEVQHYKVSFREDHFPLHFCMGRKVMGSKPDGVKPKS